MSERRTSETRAVDVSRGLLATIFLCALATVQCVWFYLSRIPSAIHLPAYESGRERVPFQHRLLLQRTMQLAHNSSACKLWAARLTALPVWFPHGARPEGLVQAAIDVACIAVAGLSATEIYRRSSRTGLLVPYMYPLVLLMVVATYVVLPLFTVRFLYDLPSLAFFAAGLCLIYARLHPGWFAAVFLLGTVNRETTLLLLLFYLLAACSREGRFAWRQGYAPASLAVVLPLAAMWIGWQLWVAHRFAANPSAVIPRASTNLCLLLNPMAWPQLFGACGYLLPVVILGRRRIADPVLRAWIWALPIWFLFMLYFALFLEIRVFGELIPFVACAAALIAEESWLSGVASRQAAAA